MTLRIRLKMMGLCLYTSAVDVVKRFMICMSSGHRDMVAVRTLEQFMFTTRREMQQTTFNRFLQVS